MLHICPSYAAGAKARGKPRDTWQTTVYKDVTSLHAQFKWFSTGPHWLEAVDGSRTHLAGPAEPV